MFLSFSFIYKQKSPKGRLSKQTNRACKNKFTMTKIFEPIELCKNSEPIRQEKMPRGNFKDLTNLKFGRLIVSGFSGRNNQGALMWDCKCKCGNNTRVIGNNLSRGRTTSCGCFSIEKHTTHGHNSNKHISATYRSWCNMLSRCQNEKRPDFKDYGGRGITVCERWLKFENFLEDMGDKPDRLTLDRENNNLGYFKENCRWANQIRQCNNRRSTIIISFAGKSQSITQWAREKGITKLTLWNRLNKLGWSIEKSLTEPILKKSREQDIQFPKSEPYQ